VYVQDLYQMHMKVLTNQVILQVDICFRAIFKFTRVVSGNNFLSFFRFISVLSSSFCMFQATCSVLDIYLPVSSSLRIPSLCGGISSDHLFKRCRQVKRRPRYPALSF